MLVLGYPAPPRSKSQSCSCIRDWGINKTEEQGYALRQGCAITLTPANHGGPEPAHPMNPEKTDNHKRLSSLL